MELADGTRIDAGEVVLCAGVIQDPLLLWRSGIGPADGVRALGIEPVLDLPAVGAHMTDHFVMSFAAEVPAELAPDDAPTLQNILRDDHAGGRASSRPPGDAVGAAAS